MTHSRVPVLWSFISPRFASLTFFLLYLIIPHTHGLARVVIRLNRYENPQSLKFNGLCCDGERSGDNGCPFECDYNIRICLGSSISSPCSFAETTLSHLQHEGDFIQFPVPFLADGSSNPFSFSFDRWPGSAIITAFVYDQDTNVKEEIDTIQFAHSLGSPVRGFIQQEDYVVYNVLGNRAVQPSRFNLSVAVACGRYFHGDSCDVRCVDTNDCNGHYRCDPDSGDTICLEGWDGPNCNTPVGTNIQCSNDVNCNGNGECVKSGPADNDFYCCCHPGFSGFNCSVNVDACADSPCRNGRCVPERAPQFFRCDCTNGWKGELCDQRMTCDDNPCQNDGICLHSPLPEAVGSISCHCDPLIAAGEFCETLLTTPPQTTSPTVSGMTTMSTQKPTRGPLAIQCGKYYYGTDCSNYCKPSNDCFGHFSCDTITGEKVCLPGWSGKNCTMAEEPDSQCTCLNGGHCFLGTCCCPPEFTGVSCQEPSSFCRNSPCQHGGTCFDDSTGTGCHCREGFTGQYCESLLYRNKNCRPNFYGRDCSVYCEPKAGCGEAQYWCDELTGAKLCGYGYMGAECNRPDPNAKHDIPCPDSICRNNGVCRNSTCCCPQGYTGSLCHIEILECDSKPCLNDGQCEDLIGGYRCTCKEGFTGNNCEEDLSESPSSIGSTTPQPNSTPGSRPCDPNPCGLNGLCVQNGTDNFVCLCHERYVGERCETMIIGTVTNPSCPPYQYGSDCSVVCYEQDTCYSHNYCDPTTGAVICRSGWQGDYCSVRALPQEIDPECPSNGAACLNRGECFLNTCCCSYPFTGERCEREQLPCSNRPCGDNGQCLDQLYGFKCICNPGYTGDLCDVESEITMPVNPSVTPPFNTPSSQNVTMTNEITSGFPTIPPFPPVPCSDFFCYKGGNCVQTNGVWACQCLTDDVDEFCQTILPTESTIATTEGSDVTIAQITDSSSSTLRTETTGSGYSTESTTPVIILPPIPCGTFFCYSGGKCQFTNSRWRCQCPSTDMDAYCRTLTPTDTTSPMTEIQTSEFPITQNPQSTGFTDIRTASTTPETTVPPVPCGDFFCYNGGTCAFTGSVYICICPSSNVDQFCQSLPMTQSTAVTTESGRVTNERPTDSISGTPSTQSSGTTLSTTPETTIPPIPCSTFFCYNGGDCLNTEFGWVCQCPSSNMDMYCKTLPPAEITSPVSEIRTSSAPQTQSTQSTGISETTPSTTPATTIPPIPCSTFFCHNGGNCLFLTSGWVCECPSSNMDRYCQFLPTLQSTAATTQSGDISSEQSSNALSSTPNSLSTGITDNAVSTMPATSIPPIQCSTFFCYSGGKCQVTNSRWRCQCPSTDMDVYCRALTPTDTTSPMTEIQTSEFPITQNPQSTGFTDIRTASTTPETTFPPVPCGDFFCYNGGTCAFTGSVYICQCQSSNTDRFCRALPTTQSTAVTTESELVTSEEPTGSLSSTPSTQSSGTRPTGSTLSSTPETTLPPIACGTFFCYNGGNCLRTDSGWMCQCPSSNMDAYCQFLLSIQSTAATTQSGEVSNEQSSNSLSSTPNTVSTGTTDNALSTTPATSIPPIPCSTFFCYSGGSCQFTNSRWRCQCPSTDMDIYCRTLTPTDTTSPMTEIQTSEFPITQNPQSTGITENTAFTTPNTTLAPIPCSNFFCYSGGSCLLIESGWVCQCPSSNMDAYCQFLPTIESTAETTNSGRITSEQSTNYLSSTPMTKSTGTTESISSTTPETTLPPTPCGNFFCYNSGDCLQLDSGWICQCLFPNTDAYCRTSTQTTKPITQVQTSESPQTQSMQTSGTTGSTLSTTPVTALPPTPCGDFYCYNGGHCLFLDSGWMCQCPSQNMDVYCRTLSSSQTTSPITEIQTSEFPQTRSTQTSGATGSTLSTTPETTFAPIPCGLFYCYNGGACLLTDSGWVCQCPLPNMDEFCKLIPSTQSPPETTELQTSESSSNESTGYITRNTLSTTPGTTVPPVQCGNKFCHNGGTCSFINTVWSCQCPSPNMDESCRTLPTNRTTEPIPDDNTSTPSTYNTSNSADSTGSPVTLETSPSPEFIYQHILTGHLYIKNTVDSADYPNLIAIIENALNETYPDHSCCFETEIDEPFNQVDQEGNHLVKVQYSYILNTTSTDEPERNNTAIHGNVNRGLNSTNPFDENQNEVYTGPVYDPEKLFQIYLVGPVILEMYEKIDATIASAWSAKNHDCGCTFRAKVIYTRYYIGIYSTQLTQVTYVVWKDNRMLNLLSPERPTIAQLTSAFDHDPSIGSMYSHSVPIPYSSHYEIILNRRIELGTSNGVETLEAIRSNWQAHQQETDITIYPLQPELRYNETGYVISLFPYFTYINKTLITPVQNGGPDTMTFGAPATSCECRTKSVYSVDVLGVLDYFKALAIAETIVGQGKNGASLVDRQTIQDVHGNLATRIFYKPQSYELRPRFLAYPDIKAEVEDLGLGVPEVGHPFRLQYIDVMEGTLTEDHRDNLTNAILQAWVATNSLKAPDFIYVLPADIIIEIASIDSNSSLSDSGEEVTLVHYLVTIYRADSSLTFAARPDYRTLLDAFTGYGQQLRPCQCDHRLKQTIVIQGVIDPENEEQMERLTKAVAMAWKEVNKEYTGELIIVPHVVAPHETIEDEENLIVRKIVFTVELSGHQPGFRDRDLTVPDNDVINKHLTDNTLDVTVVKDGEDGDDSDNDDNDDDEELAWYIILIIILILILVIAIISSVVCCIICRRRKDSKRIENDPDIFMERTFDKEHFTAEPADYYNEAFDNFGTGNGHSTNYVVNPEEGEGKSVM